jgi:hypothetical protein
VIGRRRRHRHPGEDAGRPRPRRALVPWRTVGATGATGAADPLPRPVVRLGFADDSTLVLGPDDPLARSLRALAEALVQPRT